MGTRVSCLCVCVCGMKLYVGIVCLCVHMCWRVRLYSRCVHAFSFSFFFCNISLCFFMIVFVFDVCIFMQAVASVYSIVC